MGNRQASSLTPFAVAEFKGKDPQDWKEAKEALDQVTETKASTEKPFTAWGRVIRVIDGDTFVIALIVGRQIETHKVRLAGCDTPETRVTIRSDEDTIRKREGMKVKEYVTQLLTTHPFVQVNVKGREKFGRTLAYLNVYKVVEKTFCFSSSRELVLQFDLTTHLIEKGYAYAYEGGTKKR